MVFKIIIHFFSVLCLFFLLAVGVVVNGNMISSCSQTPYPEICNSVVGSSPQSTADGTAPFEFRDLALRANMDSARRAHRLLLDTDLGALDERGKLAWADCVELSEDTMNHLSSSLTSTDPTSYQDAQTWLSAAIANQQTCRNGFVEANLSSHLASLPLMSTQLSKLLSNSLAINKAAAAASAAASTSTSSGNSGGRRRRLLTAGFPKWVSGVDRKLLQLSSVASLADVVVARDGSGNYRTISGALSAYKKLSGRSKRFVIYVKAGVYRENVRIDYNMTNVMLIGDGIDSTVVTGNRSFQDGLTTYRTATFGIYALFSSISNSAFPYICIQVQ